MEHTMNILTLKKLRDSLTHGQEIVSQVASLLILGSAPKHLALRCCEELTNLRYFVDFKIDIENIVSVLCCSHKQYMLHKRSLEKIEWGFTTGNLFRTIIRKPHCDGCTIFVFVIKKRISLSQHVILRNVPPVILLLM
jgi:hypothetical protein